MTIGTSFNDGFKSVFDEIKALRPDLKNNSEIVQEAVREFIKNLKQENKELYAKNPALGMMEGLVKVVELSPDPEFKKNIKALFQHYKKEIEMRFAGFSPVKRLLARIRLFLS